MIEALGDYKAQYAFDALTAIAKLDGPLQDDAALALGKIGDKRALETLAGLQRTRAAAAQPAIAAAICLLGVNCDSHENYLDRDAEVRRPERRIPGAAARRGVRPGRARRSPAGRRPSTALFDVGIPSRRSDARAGRAGARRRWRCATRR